MGQSRRNPPPRPPSRPARSGGRPPRPAPPPQRSSRPRPDEDWSDEQETPRGQAPARSQRPRPMPPLPPVGSDEADYDDDGEDNATDDSLAAPRPRSGPASRRPPEDDGPDPFDDPRAPRALRRAAPEPRRSRPRDYDDYDDADESDQRWRQPRDDRGHRGGRRGPAGPDDSYGDHYGGDRYGDDSYGGAPGYAPPRSPSRPRPAGGGRPSGGRPSGRDGRDPRQPYDAADVYSEWERPGGGPNGHGGPRGQYSDRYNNGYDNGARNRGGRGGPHPGWREAASQWLSAAVPVPMPGKKRKRVPVVLLLVIVLVVLAVPSALFGPKVLSRLTTSSTAYHGPPGTYTPGPTPPAQSGFKKYVNAGANYSMDYPQAWTATKQDQSSQGQADTIDVFAPATPTGTSMLIEQPSAADATPDADVITGEVAAAQQGGVTFTATSSFPIQVNIGGEFWQRQDYLVSGNGPTSHEAILAGHHEGHAYVIVLMSGADTFSQDAATIFTPALTSFRFNS